MFAPSKLRPAFVATASALEKMGPCAAPRVCFTIKYTDDDIVFLMNRNRPGKIIKFEKDSREVFDYKYINIDRGIYVYHKIDRPHLQLTPVLTPLGQLEDWKYTLTRR
jgi:hypothetical protein